MDPAAVIGSGMLADRAVNKKINGQLPNGMEDVQATVPVGPLSVDEVSKTIVRSRVVPVSSQHERVVSKQLCSAPVAGESSPKPRVLSTDDLSYFKDLVQITMRMVDVSSSDTVRFLATKIVREAGGSVLDRVRLVDKFGMFDRYCEVRLDEVMALELAADGEWKVGCKNIS